jgi:hypothetical protein
MKKLITAVCFMFAVSPLALGQDKPKDGGTKSAPTTEKSAKKEPTEKQKAQQERMKACAEKAGDKKGEERKKFMSGCLKSDAAAADAKAADKKTAQQDKMKACNKQAGDKKLKGDERKKFMSECLKG